MRRLGTSARRIFLLWVATAIWLVGVVSSAQSPPEALPVEVTLVGRTGEEAELAQRIESWFDAQRFMVDVHVAAELEPVRVLAPEPRPGLRVWVSLKGDRLARLYFVTVSADLRSTYLLRDIALEQGLDELGAERVATVLHLSSMALLEGQATTARAEVERSLSASNSDVRTTQGVVEAAITEQPAPRAPADESFSLSLGLGYALALRGDEGLGHGPRLSGGIEGQRYLVRLFAHSALPATRALAPIDLRLYSLGATLTAGPRHLFATHWAFHGYAGAGAQYVHFEPQQRSRAGVEVLRAESELRAHVLVGLGLALRLTHVELVLAVECAIALQDTHYDLRTGAGTRELGSPGPVAPALAFELRI